MTQLVYTQDEIMSDHDYARPQIEDGKRLHGGFDADGNYLSPRTLVRPSAVAAWAEALRARGGDIQDVDDAIDRSQRYPNPAQQKLLLQESLDQSFWDMLTITGVVEARGRMLAAAVLPELQDVIVEDVSGMGIGHLNKGLLKAHGLDEGGEPERGIGAHDVMWFVARDLAFGPRSYPMPDIPEILGRPDADERRAPELPEAHERLILLLMNVLLIELNAESLFRFTEDLLRDPGLFTDRRSQAEDAADLVNRIRLDEEIHVSSLRTVLGELRSITFKAAGGGTIPGAELCDRLWDGLVRWSTGDQPKLRREQQRASLTRRILAHPDGGELLERFNALES